MRVDWIDWLRGLAVVAMVLFHLSFDLAVQADSHWAFARELPELYWIVSPKLIGGTFFILMGVSAHLRFESARGFSNQMFSTWALFKRPLLRILMGALMVSFATSFLGADRQIKFGVLHGLAASLALLIPVIDRPSLLWTLGLPAAAIGIVFRFIVVPFDHLWWLGFLPQNRTSLGLDVYPVLPWVGIVYMSAALAPRLLQVMAPLNRFESGRVLKFLGRHSLLIYLVHQPLLMGLMKIFIQLKTR